MSDASRVWLPPVARIATVGLVCAGVVLGADGLGALPEALPRTAGERAPVTRVETFCPGDPFDDKAEVEVSGSVTGLAAPAPVLDGVITPSEEPGRLSLEDLSEEPAPTSDEKPTSGPTSVGRDELDTAVRFRAVEAYAPAAVAVQSFVAGGEQASGLAAVSCAAPTADAWLVGGGAEKGRQERLVLVNPGGNAITVRVEALGTEGEESVVVPARGREVVLMDAIGGTDTPQAVHVASEGGFVVPTLVDQHLEGLTPSGVDTVAPTAAPGTRHMIPANADGQNHGIVVGVPGDSDAVVQVRSLTADGSRSAVVQTVPAGTVVDLDLPDVKGVHAWVVEADEPIVTAAHLRTEAGNGTSDMAWSVATQGFGGLGGVALPDIPSTARRYVNIVSDDGPATVEVLTLVDDKISREEVSIEQDSSVEVPIGQATAVWVRPTSGTIHAGVLLIGREGDANALAASLPIESARVAVRDVEVVRRK